MPRSLSPLDVKPSLPAYPSWLRRKFRLTKAVHAKADYDLVSSSLKRQFEKSAFWLDVLSSFNDWESAYRLSHSDYGLLVGQPPTVVTKDWDRFLTKTWRHNVHNNANWPDPPRGDWLLPPRWYGAINDVVRTLLVVKYMDGVPFLGERLEYAAAQHGCSVQSDLLGTPTGYYAGHVVIRHAVELRTSGWRLESREVPVEIQITTQLHEVIRRLLHRHYEKRRVADGDDYTWQWDQSSEEFQANYLGHILHYVDGQILLTRDAEPG
jgi:hypothetical protein